jgi:hypothetical protein
MRGLVDAVKVTPNTSSIGPAPSSNCSTCCRPAANSGSTAQRSLSVNYMQTIELITMMMMIVMMIMVISMI